MKRYLFTVRIIGNGNSEEDAWNDALESFGAYSEPLPDKDDILKLDDEEENDWKQY